MAGRMLGYPGAGTFGITWGSKFQMEWDGSLTHGGPSIAEYIAD